jgi:hypothetical protein
MSSRRWMRRRRARQFKVQGALERHLSQASAQSW